MFHSRNFLENNTYRISQFLPLRLPSSDQPINLTHPIPAQAVAHFDGNPTLDRPLTVQFCANDPGLLLDAARMVQNHCDAVDLNLGCPQGIARRGRYGAYLQDDWDCIHRLISTLHRELIVPVTAKMRILDTRERTLDYARMILSAGASILAVHGRTREQKGQNTGLADWDTIRYLRDNLPPETVMFANGNILRHEDIERCLKATGVDGVMSAEGCLGDPSIFATPPAREDRVDGYWFGNNDEKGWRMDFVLRRYLDIIYKHVLNQDPPSFFFFCLALRPASSLSSSSSL